MYDQLMCRKETPRLPEGEDCTEIAQKLETQPGLGPGLRYPSALTGGWLVQKREPQTRMGILELLLMPGSIWPSPFPSLETGDPHLPHGRVA